MKEKNISEQMSFEEYLKQVENYLTTETWRTEQDARKLMTEYADDLKELYKDSLSPTRAAGVITSGLM